MSHVAHLSVVTKTEAEVCAWKAHYLDGTLVEAKPGQTAEPKPCAGNDGTRTTIIIEDLFYNTPSRLLALRSAYEDFLQLQEEILQAIRLLYGHPIAKDLLHATFGPSKNDEDMDEEPDRESWTVDLCGNGLEFLHRSVKSVESSRMNRATEAVYSGVLPKGASPFIYLSLQINPRDVDVNQKAQGGLGVEGSRDRWQDPLLHEGVFEEVRYSVVVMLRRHTVSP
ncbi:hypothetical protein C8R47DRAFT_1212010 [Mycena vitilis]|nr:hypothetical protein C8R47DRAFT_1212010 [Mycena vitilis]